MVAVSPAPDPFERHDTADVDLSPNAGEELVGTTICGRYEVRELIGSGAFGDVFRVEHVHLGREFALKVLKVQHTFDEVTVQRFRREARAAAAVKHPGIVDITDFGETDARQPFIVMEWVDASTLDAVLEQAGTLPIAKAEDIMLQVAQALTLAHASDIVHRDLKPENLLLRSDGVVKIADFGLCAFGEGDGGKRLTKMGQIFGTPYYMAPERLEAGASGPGCDVYSLGCIIFELVTGEPAFEADDIMAVLRCHLMDPPPSMASSSVQHVPEYLDRLIADCLAKAPDDRPTMLEITERLGDGSRRASLLAAVTGVHAAPDAEALALLQGPPADGELGDEDGDATVPDAAVPRPSAPARGKLIALVAAGLVLAVIGAAVGLSRTSASKSATASKVSRAVALPVSPAANPLSTPAAPPAPRAAVASPAPAPAKASPTPAFKSAKKPRATKPAKAKRRKKPRRKPAAKPAAKRAKKPPAAGLLKSY